MELILILALALSLFANFYLLKVPKKPERMETHSIEAQELLRELLSGPAIVKIDIIDKSRIFLRSPKTL